MRHLLHRPFSATRKPPPKIVGPTAELRIYDATSCVRDCRGNRRTARGFVRVRGVALTDERADVSFVFTFVA